MTVETTMLATNMAVESNQMLLSHCKYQTICLCSFAHKHCQTSFTLFV